MENKINELKSHIVGKTFIAKKTGIEGEIVDINLSNLFIEIEIPGAITIPIKSYTKFIEVDDEIKNAINDFLKVTKNRKKEGKQC